MMVHKVVFMGPPATGKTSLRKALFEGVSPDSLLASSEPASIGMKFTRYQYVFSEPGDADGRKPRTIPVDLALVDTAGQELEKWLGASASDLLVAARVIFFMFDVQAWADEAMRTYLCDLVLFLNELRLDLAPESILQVLVTKYDLLGKPASELGRTARDIQAVLEDRAFESKRLMLRLPVTVTSLAAPFRQATFASLASLLTQDLPLA